MTSTIRRTALTATLLCCALPASAMAAVPSVTTGGAKNVSPDAATVNGSVNPGGQVTTWYFQYGRTKSYGARTTALDAGSGKKRLAVSSTLTGLLHKTTYHYRLVATNGAGRTFGHDRTFKTLETPTVSTIAAGPNPARVGQTVGVTGFLIGPRGGGGKQVALEARSFPYTAPFGQVGPTILTAPDGSYSFQFPALVSAQLQVVDRSDPKVVSPVWSESVASRVSIRAKRKHGSRVVRFSGHVTPTGAASAVVIQRRTHKRGWKNVKVTLPRTKAGRGADRWSRRIRTGRGVFRAVARSAGGAYVEGISRKVRVKRP